MRSSRRDFLKTAAAAAAGVLLPFQSVRRRRFKVIDVHGHFIATEELDLIKDTPLATNRTENVLS